MLIDGRCLSIDAEELFHAQKLASFLVIVDGLSPSFKWETRQDILQKWSCEVWSYMTRPLLRSWTKWWVQPRWRRTGHSAGLHWFSARVWLVKNRTPPLRLYRFFQALFSQISDADFWRRFASVLLACYRLQSISHSDASDGAHFKWVGPVFTVTRCHQSSIV